MLHAGGVPGISAAACGVLSFLLCAWLFRMVHLLVLMETISLTFDENLDAPLHSCERGGRGNGTRGRGLR